MRNKVKYLMIYTVFVLFTLIWVACKKNETKNNPLRYTVKSSIEFDSIEYQLINTRGNVKYSIKVKNNSSLIDKMSSKLNINRNKSGWSCRNQDKIYEFNRSYDSLANFINIQERFLSKIIEIERLGEGDEDQLVNHWKDISDQNIISSIDPEWDLVQRNYFENLVLKFDSSRTVLLNFDTCEKEEFLKFRAELEDSNNQNIYTSVNLRIGQETDVNSEVFFNPMYKKLTFSSDVNGITNIKISRPLQFYR